MAKSRPSVQKRANEARKLDKKQMKQARAARRREEAEERAALVESGVDPDLVGIVPGPQPVLPTDDEWNSAQG